VIVDISAIAIYALWGFQNLA